jgi:hypothetical protein
MGKLNEQLNEQLNVDSSSIFSLRIGGRSTSFSVKNKFIAFYCTVAEIECDQCFNEFSDTVLDIARDWKGTSAKGLSDFVVGKILENLLRKKELKKYFKILQKLR